MEKEYIVVTVPCPVERAEELAEKIFTEKVSPVVHVKAPHKTVYNWGWENETNRHEECEILMKLPRSHYKQLESFILEHHPFKCPSILATPIVEGYGGYLKWLDEEIEKKD